MEIPRDWIRVDIEPVTESCCQGAATHTHTHKDCVLLNGQAVETPFTCASGSNALAVCASAPIMRRQWKPARGKERSSKGPNFMHNDDFVAS